MSSARAGDSRTPSAGDAAFPQTLRHPLRQRLRDLIDEVPALNIQEIADILQVQRTAANHHVRRLVKDGFVLTHRQGPHLLHFSAGVAPTQRIVLTVLRIPSVRGIAFQVLADPTISAIALALRLRMTLRTVSRGLRTLKTHGLLQVERGTHSRRVFHLHPELRIALAHLGSQGAKGKGSGSVSGPDAR